MVPSADQNPLLRFWHWWSFNCENYGQVQVRGSKGWENLSQQFTGVGNNWTVSPGLSLTPYAGQTVQLGFYFYSDNSPLSGCGPGADVGPGWYIDDVFVKKGNLFIAPIADKATAEINCLTFSVNVTGNDANSILSFRMGAGAPEGARIDPSTGVFTWCPAECQGPDRFTIPIYVVDYGNSEANDLGFVTVTVNEVNESPWLLPGGGAAYVGQTNVIALCSGDQDCPANPLTYSLLGAAPTGAGLDANTGVLTWAPTADQVGTYDLLVRLCEGGSPNYCVTNTLTVAVTAHLPYRLEVDPLPNGDLQFTIVDGRTDVEYELERTSEVCECPCQPVWEPLLRVAPETMPYSFAYPNAMLDPVETWFFRLKEVSE